MEPSLWVLGGGAVVGVSQPVRAVATATRKKWRIVIFITDVSRAAKWLVATGRGTEMELFCLSPPPHFFTHLNFRRASRSPNISRAGHFRAGSLWRHQTAERKKDQTRVGVSNSPCLLCQFGLQAQWKAHTAELPPKK